MATIGILSRPVAREASKGGHDRAAKTEGELNPSSSVDQSRGQVHQLRQDGAVTPRSLGAKQTILPNEAQNIVGELGAGEDQGVGGQLPRRQTLNVQVGLEFAVELLGGGMVHVEGNDRLLIELQARPPALELDLWKRPCRSMVRLITRMTRRSG